MSHKKKIIVTFMFLSLIGGYLGNFNNLAVFASKVFPVSDPNENIYGIWLSKYQYDVPAGLVGLHGTTEYFKNSKYHYIGEMSIEVSTDKDKINLVYDIEGTGTWQAGEGSLIIQLEDLKSRVKSVAHNGVSIDAQLYSQASGKDFPVPEDTFPKGISEEYKIIRIAKNELVVTADDPLGKVFEIIMKRQDKRFQR